MTISGFVAYVKQAWKNKPDTSSPLSAARLTHVEEGVKANSDAIAKIAAAVINQQANDANKIPSSALMYSVNEKVDSAISDLGDLMSNTFTSDTTHMLNGVTANEFNYARFGHIATVSGLINPSAVTTTGEVKIYTLPETYHPSRAIYFSIASNDSAITMTYGVVKVDGSVLIQLNDAVAKGSHKLFSVSYYVA